MRLVATLLLVAFLCHHTASAQATSTNCTADSDCKDASYYCRKFDCYAKIGVCYTAAAIRCSSASSPVCGCDGNSYNNACLASVSKMNVDYETACRAQIKCTSNTQCRTGQFCRRPKGCAQAGVCDQTPIACTTEYIPVCGCDQNSYNNKCAAAAQGVSVWQPGTCKGLPKPPVPKSACKNNTDCSAGSLCLRPTGRCNSAGRCFRPRKSCTNRSRPPVPLSHNEQRQPPADQSVCGCDGKTYANSCAARAALVNVKQNGRCDMRRSLAFHDDDDEVDDDDESDEFLEEEDADDQEDDEEDEEEGDEDERDEIAEDDDVDD